MINERQIENYIHKYLILGNSFCPKLISITKTWY